MYFLVAYDIADPRRLQRVARFMERRALRFQKSVFLYQGDLHGVERLLNEVVHLLDVQEDIVQVWKLAKGQPLKGWYRGRPMPLDPAGCVLSPYHLVLVEKPERREE
ncbi:MAG: CRISPR-associated endonuclease Cas2 [Gemmatales bacterium]|nr:CRISPR-associated endonuclease Cas2 [Gemmatales bacterium]MCS7160461.1 CRISPR-associated endonuclease Cas2 [Gemmatales bacterium]MDW8175661.1 CRISPR-associated endonuclease Cas2 [Gemmatales bacterium]MDW8223857.1 CRISPR-associated endonuclease Cas2 [Gemmatales bacterium]